MMTEPIHRNSRLKALNLLQFSQLPQLATGARQAANSLVSTSHRAQNDGGRLG
jgi:hypothetical protein